MHDLRALREHPEVYDAGLGRARGLPPQTPARILELDEHLRACQTALQAAQSGRNEASQVLIGKAKAEKDEATAQALVDEVEKLKLAIAVRIQKEGDLGGQLRDLLSGLPNLPASDVPAGTDETANKEVRRWGEPFAISAAKDHVDLGAGLGMMDFEAAARMSGARFVVLSGQLARLERALGQFMIDMQTQEHGYPEIAPPLLVRDEAMFGSGQLPKFAEELFATTDERWLIPTAETPLANLVRERILAEDELPMRLTALTPCFRSEAGASGKDTRGMIRQHQFNKVELVSVTAPETVGRRGRADDRLRRGVLKRLELPFRTVLLCAGDAGPRRARKTTYDLPVWLPSQKTWRRDQFVLQPAATSQARRMDARFPEGGREGRPASSTP